MTNPQPAQGVTEWATERLEALKDDPEYLRELLAIAEDEVAALRVRLQGQPAQGDGVPVAMVLRCPSCAYQHVDEGEWATRPHRTHLCADCGAEWRPFDYATVGVETTAQGDGERRWQVLTSTGSIRKLCPFFVHDRTGTSINALGGYFVNQVVAQRHANYLNALEERNRELEAERDEARRITYRAAEVWNQEEVELKAEAARWRGLAERTEGAFLALKRFYTAPTLRVGELDEIRAVLADYDAMKESGNG